MSLIKVLLNVTYSDNTNKFWSESYLKNAVVTIDTDKNIHDQIAQKCADSDSMYFSYKNKPVSNIFVDSQEGSKIVGYCYRAKTEIGNKKALFDVWVKLNRIVDMEFEEIK